MHVLLSADSLKNKVNYERYSQENSFMEGRIMPKNMDVYVNSIGNFIEKYPDYELYIFGNNSYIIKLEYNLPINKFDLINNGNMGYKGEDKYIKDIEKNCANNNCLFIIDENELKRTDYTQVNKKILNYVIKNTTKVYSTNTFGAYINRK